MNKLVLTGTKYGCGIGACGACTVLLRARLFVAVLSLFLRQRAKKIETIESLEKNGQLSKVQKLGLKTKYHSAATVSPAW